MSYPAGGYYAGYAENSHVNSGQPIDWQEVTFVHKNASRYGFVQLPVLARYTWTVKPNIRIHVALGPYIAIGVNGKKSLHAKIIDLKNLPNQYMRINLIPLTTGIASTGA